MNEQNYSTSLLAAIKLAKAMARQDKHHSYGDDDRADWSAGDIDLHAERCGVYHGLVRHS